MMMRALSAHCTAKKPFWNGCLVLLWCSNTCSTAASILGYREKFIGNYNNYTIHLVK